MSLQSSWPFIINDFEKVLTRFVHLEPWELTFQAAKVVEELQQVLFSDYEIKDGIAIHATAQIEPHVIMKAPVIIGPNSFIASHAYLRGGVLLVGKNSIGPGCEIKSSMLFANTNLAHFNFVGDSIVGANVNLEAGAVIANHFNERTDKTITVTLRGTPFQLPVQKFGALIGDGCKIGANAVLSPGTILEPRTVVGRLALI